MFAVMSTVRVNTDLIEYCRVQPLGCAEISAFAERLKPPNPTVI